MLWSLYYELPFWRKSPKTEFFVRYIQTHEKYYQILASCLLIFSGLQTLIFLIVVFCFWVIDHLTFVAHITPVDSFACSRRNMQCLLIMSAFILSQNCKCYWRSFKCGMIKQNELEFANIDLEIEPNKGNKSFCFLLFWQPFNGSYNLRMTCPNFDGVFCKI